MTVICWEGKPRTGKTLGMVFYAFNNHANLGFETFSNFDLNWKHTKMDIYDILEIPFNDVERNPKQLMLQEADKWFDSWLKTEENRLLSSLTGQSGKRNLEILYDTQFYSRIQKSLRRVTDMVISCSCYVDRITKKPLVFEQLWQEPDANENLIPKRKPVLIPAKVLEPFYNMYNSYETTRPFVTGGKEGYQ